jgi:hypothetical protein
MAEQPPPVPERAAGWLTAVKGLTISNAVVVVMLVIAAIPAYFVYRALNDQSLLDKFMSAYREIPSPGSNCTIREARVRGGSNIWSIGTGFAYQGTDRWTVSVILDHLPTEADIISYCTTLNIIVDDMHGDNAGPP